MQEKALVRTLVHFSYESSLPNLDISALLDYPHSGLSVSHVFFALFLLESRILIPAPMVTATQKIQHRSDHTRKCCRRIRCLSVSTTFYGYLLGCARINVNTSYLFKPMVHAQSGSGKLIRCLPETARLDYSTANTTARMFCE
jgi:hypothetical protein